MVEQQALFHESLADAIGAVVAACGGSKVVGRLLWPEKAPDAAGRLLQDCLNDGSPEKLSPDQVLLVAKLGREKGAHAIVTHICREAGYADPIPVEPEDERAKLQRESVEAVRHLGRLVDFWSGYSGR